MCENSKGNKASLPLSYLVDLDALPLLKIQPILRNFDVSSLPRTYLEAQMLYSNCVNSFGTRLTDAIFPGSTKNVLISPISLHQALMVLTSGAKGETFTQLCNEMGFPGMTTIKQFTQFYSLIGSYINFPFEMVNSLWFGSGFRESYDFVHKTECLFDATAQTLPADSDEAKAVINKYVADHTENLIPEAVKEVPPDMSLMIVNCVHFKAQWKHPFNMAHTHDADFHRFDGSTIEIPMMACYDAPHKYYDDGEIQYCQLTFSDSRACMIFALPRDTSPAGLAAAGRAISGPGLLGPLLAAMGDVQEFHLHIPRFRIEFDSNLTKPLKALGITLPFQPTGDLDEMLSEKTMHLQVKKVIHRAVLDVNEKGVVAVAFTGILLRGGGGPSHPIHMILDRPFACALVDPTLELAFFTALVTDPGVSTQPIEDFFSHMKKLSKH